MTIAASDPTHLGATVVITHRVKSGSEVRYDEWLKEIGPLCRNAAGLLDWHMVRPISGLTSTYTVIVRFDTDEHLRRWMKSAERRELIERVRPLLVADDNYTIRSGLDFWFTSASPTGAQVPVRWKQFLITWSAIYPLVLTIPLLIVPVLRFLHLPNNHYLDALFISASIVLLMIYLVMPRYTRALKTWLFR